MTSLQNVPAPSIVRAVADAAERWSDADFPPRVRVLDGIAARTGYSTPMVEYALDRLFFSLTREAIEETIRAELGSLAALDGFVRRAPGLESYAAPAGGVCVISSRTTIGVAIVPAAFALCAKCDVLVKDREDALVAAFFETLCEELDEFSAAARAQAWSGSEAGAHSLEPFDVVVAFGTDETVRSIAGRCAPDARAIGYGARASAGYVTRETLGDREQAADVAAGAARDAILYEGEGCLSLHVLFVEGEPHDAHCQDFLELLSRAFADSSVEFPQGTIDPARAASASEYGRLAAFRAAGGQGAVYGTPGSYALVVNPPAAEPPAFLPRALGVRFIAGPDDALAYLRLHAVPLEGFALSCGRPDAVELAIRAGASRIAGFGSLQNPPASGHHGGRARIADFVRWVDKSL